jgi:hypothetical protein
VPWIRRALDAVPGEKYLGMYRFLPLFFVLGAALEFSMIKWDVNGQVNFCKHIFIHIFSHFSRRSEGVTKKWGGERKGCCFIYKHEKSMELGEQASHF